MHSHFHKAIWFLYALVLMVHVGCKTLHASMGLGVLCTKIKRCSCRNFWIFFALAENPLNYLLLVYGLRFCSITLHSWVNDARVEHRDNYFPKEVEHFLVFQRDFNWAWLVKSAGSGSLTIPDNSLKICWCTLSTSWCASINQLSCMSPARWWLTPNPFGE